MNLLPQEVKTDQRSRRMVGLAVMGVVGLLFILGVVTVVQRMQIADANNTLDAAKTQAASLRTQVGALREFEELKTAMDRNRALLGDALKGDIALARFLDDLDTNMPSDSWLKSVEVAALVGTTPQGELSLGEAKYEGFVTSFPGLAGWIDTMSGIKGLRFVYLSQGQKQDVEGRGEVVQFSSSAHVTEHMFSNRCQGEGSQCP